MSSVNPNRPKQIDVFDDKAMQPVYHFKSVSSNEAEPDIDGAITHTVKITFESLGVPGVYELKEPSIHKYDFKVTIPKPEKPTYWEKVFKAVANWLNSIFGTHFIHMGPPCLDMQVGQKITFSTDEKDKKIYNLGLEGKNVSHAYENEEHVFTFVDPNIATFVMRPIEEAQGITTRYELERVA